MTPAPSFLWQLARFFTALLSATGIMMAGTLATSYTSGRSVQNDSDTRLCNSDEGELNRLAIRLPHLRVISFLQGQNTEQPFLPRIGRNRRILANITPGYGRSPCEREKWALIIVPTGCMPPVTVGS